MKLDSTSAEQTRNIAKIIGKYLQKGDVIALQGTLAAGKTTFTKGLAESLNIDEEITSPTFNIISEYYGRLPLYHMDVYRLDSAESFIDLGVDELIYGGGVCVIEWSEKIMEELPKNTIIIHIELKTDDSRTITIQNWPYGEISL